VDSAYRIGGDEFVVLLPGLDRRHLLKVVRRINACSAAKDYGGLVTLSIGIATLRPRDRARDLVRRADELMYRVKRRRSPRASSNGTA
jgi:diguanylate cyclase (GGDEF)-like protein